MDKTKNKILITGMNKNQCTEDFYLRQQLQVVPSHYSLLRCLRDMNYEVEQRVEPREVPRLVDDHDVVRHHV